MAASSSSSGSSSSSSTSVLPSFRTNDRCSCRLNGYPRTCYECLNIKLASGAPVRLMHDALLVCSRRGCVVGRTLTHKRFFVAVCDQSVWEVR